MREFFEYAAVAACGFVFLLIGAAAPIAFFW